MVPRSELLIANSKRPGLEITIPEGTDQDDFLTLKLKGDMTPGVAELLACEYLYVNNTPQGGFKEVTLDLTFADVELKLLDGSDGVHTYYPESIYGWRVYRKGEGQLGVQCKVDMHGHYEPILDFFRANRSDGFKFIIRSRQGELFEGGTRSASTTDEPMSDVIDATLEGIKEATDVAEMLLPPPEPEATPEATAEPPLASRPRRRRGKVHGEAQPPEEPAGDTPPWEEGDQPF